MSKKLLQEILDFKEFGSCLTGDLYKIYKAYLIEKVLYEYSPNYLYFVCKNGNHEKITTAQRIERAKNQFKNTKISYKRNKENGQLMKEPTCMTHLQTISNNFCTKEIFEKEFLNLEFSDQENLKEAKMVLQAIMDLFEDDGWLKTTFSQGRRD